MIKEEDILKLKDSWDKIKAAQRILLVSHLNPDGDALASLGAIIDILERLGKDYLAFADYKSEDYQFLPHEEKIIASKDDLFKIIQNNFNQGQDLGPDFLDFFDLLIVFDCGSIERTSLVEYIDNVKDLMLNTFIIEFDHHVPSRTYADLEIKIPLASTTEILYYFFKFNEIEINRAVANCILTGLLTDTANFLYPSVSSETLNIASEMMSLGAQYPKLLNETWRNKSLAEMKLWGLALNNLQVNNKYNIAFSYLLYEDLKYFKENFPPLGGDIFGDIAGFLSNLSETDTVLLLREEEWGIVKGNLRVGSTKKDIDISKLANYLGGGGHKKASGFVLEGFLRKRGDQVYLL